MKYNTQSAFSRWAEKSTNLTRAEVICMHEPNANRNTYETITILIANEWKTVQNTKKAIKIEVTAIEDDTQMIVIHVRLLPISSFECKFETVNVNVRRQES